MKARELVASFSFKPGKQKSMTLRVVWQDLDECLIQLSRARLNEDQRVHMETRLLQKSFNKRVKLRAVKQGWESTRVDKSRSTSVWSSARSNKDESLRELIRVVQQTCETLRGQTRMRVHESLQESFNKRVKLCAVKQGWESTRVYKSRSTNVWNSARWNKGESPRELTRVAQQACETSRAQTRWESTKVDKGRSTNVWTPRGQTRMRVHESWQGSLNKRVKLRAVKQGWESTRVDKSRSTSVWTPRGQTRMTVHGHESWQGSLNKRVKLRAVKQEWEFTRVDKSRSTNVWTPRGHTRMRVHESWQRSLNKRHKTLTNCRRSFEHVQSWWEGSRVDGSAWELAVKQEWEFELSSTVPYNSFEWPGLNGTFYPLGF